MAKIKQKIIVALLIIVLTASVIATINFTTIASASASAGYMELPQITVFTPGMGGNAYNWSNANGSGNNVFEQDDNSLVHKLSMQSNTANIYRASTTGGNTNNPSYTLYQNYDTVPAGSVNSCSIINSTSISKHIIIVFDSASGGQSNDIVYNEFKKMLNAVSDRVASLNPGQKKPKINLIGHSRGGITNLQYALAYPDSVHSMISIGTPFFGSNAASAFGTVVYPSAVGALTDITDTNTYEGYYNTWTNGYEEKYKNINSIAIGSTTTVDYQRAVLGGAGGDLATGIASLLSYFSNALSQYFSVPFLKNAYNQVKTDYPAIANIITSADQFAELVMIINEDVHYGTWYSDVFVPIDSQQGFKGDKNYYFTKHVKEFSHSNASLTPRRAVSDLPIIHNLQTYDSNIHDYILNNIVLSNGNQHYGGQIDTEISNVGGNNTEWLIKVRNVHSTGRSYAYNTKMCFGDDAQTWATGLNDIATFWLEAGETKIVAIQSNYFATHIVVSYTSGSTRYIRYADNLWFNNDNPLVNSNIYKMTSYKSTKTYNNYTRHNMKVGITGKNGNKWIIEVANNTGSAKDIHYNSKMCFEGDAQKWIGLSDVATYCDVGSGKSIQLEIQENAFATSIAISYTIGIQRFIFYAKELDESLATMTSYSHIKPEYYTKNGVKAAIAGKNGNIWAIEITNNTGSKRDFKYNSKMCFEGDAQNWTGLNDTQDIFNFADGATTTIYIQENGTATSIAISYMADNGTDRKVFYAKNLDASLGTMTAMSSTVDTTASSSCVAEGTLITLADGSQVPVEQLTGDEMLLVWNMQTGTFDSAPILFIDSDPEYTYEVIKLYFHDGTIVDVISEHGFWDLTLNEYVYLDNDAADYIGHWFSKQDTKNNGKIVSRKTKLIDVEIVSEITTAWSPVTYSHLCYYVNGMLSMPGGITGLINILEVDAKTMTYDKAALQIDIATYGLFTYEEFAEILPVPETIYEAFNGQYLKIAIGKGLIDFDTLGALVERYAEFF